MDQTRSTTIGALVLIGGAAAAMMFRRPDPPARTDESTGGRGFAIAVADAGPSSDVVLRDHSTAAQQFADSPVDELAGGRLAEIRDAKMRNDSANQFSTGDTATRSTRSTARPPPGIPQRYGGLMNATPNSRPATSASGAQLMTPQRRERGRREHKIRNRDTFESIALRYYGNAAYAEALFEANRDQLPSNKILPLDVTLRLPPVSQLQLNRDSDADGQSPRGNEHSKPGSRTTLGSVR